MRSFSLRLGLGAWPERASPPAVALRSQPYRLAVYGDSFAQRSQDIAGSPNSVDSGAVNPVVKKWPTDLTSRVGGVSWGAAAWVHARAKGKYVVPYQINRGVGGLNTGQLIEYGTGNSWLSDLETFLQAEQAAGRPVHGVILHAGTNDTVTNFSAGSSYNNLKTIVGKIVALGIKVALHTVLPRGNSAFPARRVDGSAGSDTGSNGNGDTRARTATLNANLLANFAGEFAAGMVKVVDAVSAFQSQQSGDQSFDIEPAYAYDGLHLSPVGCQLFADTLLAGLDTLFPQAVSSPLPVAAGDINSLFAGTGGTLSGGFTGIVPDGWTVGGANGWSGSLVTGTRTATIISALVGNAVQIGVAVDTSNGSLGTDKVSANLRRAVPIPVDVAVGDYFEAVARVEVENPNRFLGADLELVIAEPDGTTRTVRALNPVQVGTASREWAAGNSYTGDNALILRTPPRIRKSGSYGTITLNAMLHFSTGQASAGGTFRWSQIAVRKRLFA